MPVDVRDNAECHVGLLESVQVRSGERYLTWSGERHDVEAVSRRIRGLLRELGLAEPAIENDHRIILPHRPSSTMPRLRARLTVGGRVVW